MKKVFEFLFLLICLGGFVIGGWNLFQIYASYNRSEKEYKEISTYITKNDVSANECPYNIDFDALMKINPDIVGWIIIDGTEIRYPIVQSEDNSTYLKKTFAGTKNSCGAVFMDCDNASDFSDYNTIIYGHNMKNGSMFHDLNNYKELNYYKEHDSIWICTKEWQRKYNLISAHKANSISSTYNIAFSDRAEFEGQLISEVTSSLYPTENTYDLSKNMVVLSTCSGRESNVRFVLVLQQASEWKQ